jgi:hypothetical protein
MTIFMMKISNVELALKIFKNLYKMEIIYILLKKNKFILFRQINSSKEEYYNNALHFIYFALHAIHLQVNVTYVMESSPRHRMLGY